MALTLFPFAVALEGQQLLQSGLLFACDNSTHSMLLPANTSFANGSAQIGAANTAAAANCGVGLGKQALNWLYIFVGACIGFMLTFSEFLLVGHAGSLTLSVAGIVRI